MKKFIFILILILTQTILPFGCAKNDKIQVYAPDGAPALSLYGAIKNNDGKESFNIVDAKTIGTFVSGKNKVADVCILPINLASKLIGDGKDYKMIGSITNGNFYFLSTNNEVIKKDTATSLKGKVLGLIQLQSIAGLTLKVSLKNLGLEYIQISNPTEKDDNLVNLIAISGEEIGRNGIDLFLAPSPVADVKASKTNLNICGSLQGLYGENGYTQAVVVVKSELLKTNLNYCKNLVKNLKGVNALLNEDNISEICSVISANLSKGLTPTFNETTLTKNSIENSSIKFVLAKDCKGDITQFLSSLKQIDETSVGAILDDFYYTDTL